MKIKNRNFHKKRYLEKRFKPKYLEIWIKPYSEVNKQLIKIESLLKKRPSLINILDEVREDKINGLNMSKNYISGELINIDIPFRNYNRTIGDIINSDLYKRGKIDKQGYPIQQLDRYGAITKLLP